ncbi:MAG: FxsA family protein [Proteobacteria bacterium]|nr:FxsA family protein [Pseudomonadota bacterium]
MDFNSNPMIQKSLRKAFALVAIIFVFEVALFIGLNILFGFTYIFWITVGFILLGYAIRPSKNVSPKRLSEPFSPRRMASTLFMIPGFLTDLAAFLVLIGPVRRFMFAKIINKLLPDLSQSLNPFGTMGGNPFGGMGANPFAGLDPNQFGNLGMGNMNFGQDAANPFEAQKKRTRKKRHRHEEDIIDIEVEGSEKSSDIKAEVIRPKAESNAPKALPSDVIDV